MSTRQLVQAAIVGSTLLIAGCADRPLYASLNPAGPVGGYVATMDGYVVDENGLPRSTTPALLIVKYATNSSHVEQTRVASPQSPAVVKPQPANSTPSESSKPKQ